MTFSLLIPQLRSAQQVEVGVLCPALLPPVQGLLPTCTSQGCLFCHWYASKPGNQSPLENTKCKVLLQLTAPIPFLSFILSVL